MSAAVPSRELTRPTLVDDLEDLAKLYELAPQIRERLRAAAVRIRSEMDAVAHAPDVPTTYSEAKDHALKCVLTRVNGGPVSP